jgi:uncharacterized DUF497 family protein
MKFEKIRIISVRRSRDEEIEIYTLVQNRFSAEVVH